MRFLPLCYLSALTLCYLALLLYSTTPWYLVFSHLSYKSALVKPLLKKMSLDPDDLKNYRPVSNLSFLSNVLVIIVLSQLNEHLNHNNLLSPLQSAYRPNHSTETALLRIVNDLLTSVDNNKICILTL